VGAKENYTFVNVPVPDVDFRTKRPGRWDNSIIWEFRNTLGVFVKAKLGEFPIASNNVFLEHDVTVKGLEKCKDFNIKTSGNKVLGSECVEINGKIRKYSGAYPGTNDPTGGAEGFLGDNMIYVFKGTADLTIANSTEFGQIANGGFKTVIDYGAFKATLTGNNRMGEDLEVKTGTLEVLNGVTNIGLELRPADGVALSTKTSLIVRAKARFNFDGRPGQSATVGFGAYTLELGAFLGIKGAASFIKAENTLSLLGTTELLETSAQNFPTKEDAGELDVDTYGTILLAGAFDKTLLLNITVNTLLQISSNLNVLGAFVISYGSGATLHYKNNTVKRTSTKTEFPNAGAGNIIIEDPFDFKTDDDKIINGSLEITKGRIDIRIFSITNLLPIAGGFSSGFSSGFNI